MIELTNEIISADILKIFLYDILTGFILGIVIGLIARATWWLWHR